MSHEVSVVIENVLEVLVYFGWLFCVSVATIALLFPAAYLIFHSKRVSPGAAALVFYPSIILATYWRLKKTGKRFSNIGLNFKTKHGTFLFMGIAVGAAFMIFVFGVLGATKTAAINIRTLDYSFAIALVFGVLTTFIQSGTEEIVFRGYLLKVLSNKNSTTGIFVTAALFSILHFYHGFNLIGWLNIFLFGVLAAQLFYLSKTLWMPIGFHFGWNLFQERVFGFSVYGQTNLGFLMSVPVHQNAISGGSYGPEGSLVITAALLFAIFAVYRLDNRISLAEK